MGEIQGLVWKVFYCYNMLFEEYVGFYIFTTAWELQLFFSPKLIVIQVRTTSISFLFIFMKYGAKYQPPFLSETLDSFLSFHIL